MTQTDPHPKIEAVVYSRNGTSIRYGSEITDSEIETVEQAFEDGERDPDRLRDAIEQ